MHWIYRLLGDREWSGRHVVALNDGVNGIYLSRSNLDVAFDDSGQQINLLMARLTGSVALLWAEKTGCSPVQIRGGAGSSAVLAERNLPA